MQPIGHALRRWSGVAQPWDEPMSFVIAHITDTRLSAESRVDAVSFRSVTMMLRRSS